MMTTFRFAAPQRRRRVYTSKAPPFPVPTDNQPGIQPCGHWSYYSAYIVDDCILVKHSGDMEQLYNLGFFGKGTLSRHRPNHANSHPAVRRRDPATGENTKLKITRKRQYLHHVAWGDVENAQTHDTTENLPLPKKIKAQDTTSAQGNAEQFMRKTSEQSVKETIREPACLPSVQSTSTHASQSYIESDQKLDDDPWGSTNIAGISNSITDDPWDTTNSKDAVTFWGMETETVQPEETQTHTECGIPNDDVLVDTKGTTKDSASSSLSVEQPALSVTTEQCTSQKDTLINETAALRNKSPGGVVCPEEGTLLLDSSTAALPNISDDSACRLTALPKLPTTAASAETDPRSLADEPDADLLVVDDTDDSDIDETEITRPMWRSVAKKDPFKITESLQLCMEEAFFLSYALGCLVVYGENKEPQTLGALWCRFCAKDRQFLPRYAVYHNLRSKGWVPKSGLKYGSDFVLYKKGPAFYHATYSVVVRHVSEHGLRLMHHGNGRGDSWTSLAGLNRTTEQVSKEVMLCYVIEPEGLTTEEKKSPKCLSRLKIQEVVVRRWMSKQERENAEYVLIP